MSIFSVFCAFTLLLSHVIVINNQVNVVVSSNETNDTSKIFQAQTIWQTQKNNQAFIKYVIATIKESLDKITDDLVARLKSQGMCAKTTIKNKITANLIADAQQKYRYLDENQMHQIYNATNRYVQYFCPFTCLA